jgi:hypothetical protein
MTIDVLGAACALRCDGLVAVYCGTRADGLGVCVVDCGDVSGRTVALSCDGDIIASGFGRTIRRAADECAASEREYNAACVSGTRAVSS